MMRGLPDPSALNAIPNTGDQHKCGVVDAYRSPCPNMTVYPFCRKHRAAEEKKAPSTAAGQADAQRKYNLGKRLTDVEWDALDRFQS